MKEACELGEKLGIKNLILYHTEDTHMSDRKVIYSAEGQQYYRGNLLVPDDGEQIEIWASII